MQNTALTDQENDAVSNAMHYALELHRRGILDQAEKLYAGILKLAPDHFEAMNYLGVLKNQQGQTAEALELMAAAVEINSSWAQLLVNYGFVLNGVGRYGAALEVIDRAILIDPLSSDAEFHRGNALMGLDRVPEALGAFDAAVIINPNNVDALVNRSNAFLKLERYDEAVESVARAVAIEPAHAGILNNYGQALNASGRSSESLEYFRRSLMLDPDYHHAMINEAQALLDLGRPDEALDRVGRALEIEPGHATALKVRGLALAALGRFEQALKTFEELIAADPDGADSYVLRGNAQAALKRFAAARASFQIAAEINPTLVAAQTGEALTHLVMGDYAEGFRRYPARPRTEGSFLAPFWERDQPLPGRTLLLHADHDLADTLQFVRYVPLLAARGATVVAQVPQQLKALLGNMPDLSRVVAEGDKLPAYDLHAPLMGLPLAFETTVETIPAQVPYLSAPADRISEWQPRLPRSGRTRIGLVWASEGRGRKCSVMLERLLPLLAVAGIDWIGLQTRVGDADRAVLNTHPEILNIGEAFRDFADTAAVISALDLVISVDGAAAHLAGAMAKPVWIMLPFSPDWRWMLDRPDSPWYPTATLFRQPALDDWDSVIAKVEKMLPRG